MDEVHTDFVDRSGELVSAQQRMQGLLNAVVALAEDLSLEALLQRVVSSACRLLQAEYGALGVIGSDRALSLFITVGIDTDLAHNIGPLPTGHGVLGLLIRDPKPLRLHDLRQHPAAYGFPKNHPPMKSFLGVPVRVRDVVFGNLYLTQKKGGGDFTAEDEELAEALAAAAGVAIENARLYDDARRRTAWLQACMDVTGKMMGDEQAPEGQNGGLDMIAARALRESSSSLALILVPEDNSSLFRIEGAAGKSASEWVGRLLSFDFVEIEAVLASGKAALIEDASSALGDGEGVVEGRLLVIDLSARGTHHGLLVLQRDWASGTFSTTDMEMGPVFGSHVALALELARAHRMREQIAVFSDRDRIARDLHDLVIQRLFAAGLSIQSLRRYMTGDSAASTIRTVTGELDETIRELRNTIYSLSDSETEKELLSSRVLQAVRTGTQSLPFVPLLTLTGPIDAIRDEETVPNILAVITEGLSNAVRHSGADTIRVSVSVEDGFVRVVIQDNGTGFTVPSPGNGLSNMEHRARTLGGTFEVSSSHETGTALTWGLRFFDCRYWSGDECCAMWTAACVRRSKPSFASRDET
ncbi:GAF domain-containing protein [Pseudarthrobacter psychrotolerans]|uniref:GAF domain-containing protein n=1 Tax=Pseudarthrobacter psychrotolerans TaxID=2697569 RepID=A0A6P1NQY7_9MICC|nr:GAF domain-containing sensor histidine kinase [Pseudarthrobacter psychrotolerans]QHK22159.1 GAF domain-containing protein [Pseudarthrobacter psychrotolerans]